MVSYWHHLRALGQANLDFAQLIGGLEPERTIMLRMLESGKDVVTANKALLAEHGTELFDRARSLGRSIAFEAAVDEISKATRKLLGQLEKKKG